MSIYDQIIEMLKKEKIEYKEEKHEAEGGGVNVGKIHGMDVSHGAKAIVLKGLNDSKVIHYLAVCPADCQVDTKLISQLGAKKISFEKDKDIIFKLTGCELGAIPPFSFNPELNLIVEKSLLEKNRIFFNIGTLNNSINIKIDDYKRLVQDKAQFLEFKKIQNISVANLSQTTRNLPEEKNNPVNEIVDPVKSQSNEAISLSSSEQTLFNTEKKNRVDEIVNMVQSLLCNKNEDKSENKDLEGIEDFLIKLIAHEKSINLNCINHPLNIKKLNQIWKMYYKLNEKEQVKTNEYINNILIDTSLVLGQTYHEQASKLS